MKPKTKCCHSNPFIPVKEVLPKEPNSLEKENLTTVSSVYIPKALPKKHAKAQAPELHKSLSDKASKK